MAEPSTEVGVPTQFHVHHFTVTLESVTSVLVKTYKGQRQDSRAWIELGLSEQLS